MGFWIFMCVTVLLIPFLMISFGGLFSRSAPELIDWLRRRGGDVHYENDTL